MSNPVTINVPESFDDVESSDLKHMIADMLARLILHNDQIPLTPSNLTRFHSRATPSISIIEYLDRIIKYTSVEKCCLLLLLIYIDRVCARHRHFTISSLTVHRFIITAITVSSKVLFDSYWTNSHYARVGGITTQELNTLEREFLDLIDWQLICSGVTLQEYYENLVQHNPRYRRIVPSDHGNGDTTITGLGDYNDPAIANDYSDSAIANDYSDPAIANSDDFSDPAAIDAGNYSDPPIVSSSAYSDPVVVGPGPEYCDPVVVAPNRDYCDPMIVAPDRDYCDPVIVAPDHDYCDSMVIPADVSNGALDYNVE